MGGGCWKLSETRKLKEFIVIITATVKRNVNAITQGRRKTTLEIWTYNKGNPKSLDKHKTPCCAGEDAGLWSHTWEVGQKDQEFKANYGYIASSRPPWTIYPVSKQNKTFTSYKNLDILALAPQWLRQDDHLEDFEVSWARERPCLKTKLSH